MMRLPWRRKTATTELETQIGYRFRNTDILDEALTHPSFRFESPDATADNQRLEFLGDAVLNFVAALWLFNDRREAPEGMLTKARSLLTSGAALAEAGLRLGLDAWIKTGRGETLCGGGKRNTTLADAVEAIIGAVFLDGGMKSAERVARRLLRESFELHRNQNDPWLGNPKGQLQDYAQRHWRELPVYRDIGAEGPPHAMSFHVEVRLPDGRAAESRGRSRKAAETSAARLLLDRIEADGET